MGNREAHSELKLEHLPNQDSALTKNRHWEGSLSCTGVLVAEYDDNDHIIYAHVLLKAAPTEANKWYSLTTNGT